MRRPQARNDAVQQHVASGILQQRARVHRLHEAMAVIRRLGPENEPLQMQADRILLNVIRYRAALFNVVAANLNRVFRLLRRDEQLDSAQAAQLRLNRTSPLPS